MKHIPPRAQLGQIDLNPGPSSTMPALSFSPFIIGSGQRWAGGRLPADLVLLLHHAVAERDEVTLQDDEALAQTLGRQGAFGHLRRELLLVVNQDHEAVLQLCLICTHTHDGNININAASLST